MLHKFILIYILFIHFILIITIKGIDVIDDNKTNKLDTIFWMHIQKTSSWLGDFLLYWGCPSFALERYNLNKHSKMIYASVANTVNNLNCDVHFFTGQHGYGYHIPFSSLKNQSTITLFRNPYDRIISSFLHGKGIHQMMFPLGFPNRMKVKFALRKNISNSEYPILTYANLNGMKGCQTKMMLGMDCGVTIDLTRYHLNEAKRRLKYDMAFIGITEESKASANLFLAMYPTSSSASIVVDNKEQQQQPLTLMPQVLKLIHGNTYKLKPRKNNEHHHEANQKHHHILRSHGWIDFYDNEIYNYAKEIFYHRCLLYGITTKYNKE